MAYYHVVVRMKAKDSRSDTWLDLSTDDLEQRVLRPYRQGKPIAMRGRVIDVYDIDRIRITKTEQDSTALRPAAVRERNRSRSSGIIAIPPISLDYYIADMGEDVTDEFITVAPGSEPQEPQATLAGRGVPQKPTDTRTVFVVHGRNERAREAMFEFLRAIGLHPLEWSEAGPSNRESDSVCRGDPGDGIRDRPGGGSSVHA